MLCSYCSGFRQEIYTKCKKKQGVDQEVVVKRQDFSHVNLLKELRFHLKDWHNFLRLNESTYLTLSSMGSSLIKKKHYNAASCNSLQETYSHFKIFGDREKLRGPQVFHYNVSTSTAKNYTRDLPCYLQSAEGIL